MTGIIKTDKLQSSAGNDALTIASNGVVTAAGNVAINGASATHPLSVNGQIKSTGANGETLQLQTSSQYSGISFVGSDGTRDAIIDYDHTNGALGLKAHTSSHYINFMTGGYSERFRITDNGVTFNGDTAAANALDDYEEGSGALAVTGTGGGTAATSGTPDYQYTKVGNLVSFQFEFQCTSVSGVSGTLQIALPFTATDYGAGSIRCYSVTFDGSPFLGISNNTSQVYFKANKSGNATQSILSTGYYYGQITYKT